MKKRNSRLLACALAVVLCMTAFSIPTFAAGYYASNENGNNTPPDAIESITVSTENVNLPANSSASGIPALTPDGNLTSIDDILQSAASVSTEDSLENKQFITVQSKSGNTFYIVIDRSGDTENVYFLNLVDEADLMALMGDDAEQADTTCICQTHCEVGAINTDCPVCKASMPDCMGKAQTVQKDPEPVVDTKPEAVTDTRSDSAQKKSNAPLILLLLVLLGGGFALYWFKLRKPKPDTKGSVDLDDYDFGEDEDDTDEEMDIIYDVCKKAGVPCALSEVFAKGGEGGKALAETVLSILDDSAEVQYTYELDAPLTDKIEAVATKIYRAGRVSYTAAAKKTLDELTALGYGKLPVCIAKTQYSFSDNAKLTGAPEGHTLNVREVRLSAGAGFVVVVCGSIMTMPGLPKHPAAMDIDVDVHGKITGLF